MSGVEEGQVCDTMKEKWASPAVRQLNDLTVEEESCFGGLIEIVRRGCDDVFE